MAEQTVNSSFFLKLNQKILEHPVLQNARSVFYWVDTLILATLPKPKPSPSGKKTVLVIYNMALGDGVMFLGVADAVREIFPPEEYEVTLACQSGFAELYEEAFDYVLALDFSGSVINPIKRRALFKALRQREYDVVVDPVGSECATMNFFATRAAVAKRKIGTLDVTLPLRQLSDRMRGKVYTEIHPIDEPGLHLIEFYAEFFKKLGADNCVAHPAHFDGVSLPFDPPEDYFIVFPAASTTVKKWAPENFAALANRIHCETGLTLLVCGTKRDRASIDEMLQFIDESVPVFDCVGQTSIRQFVEVISRARYVLTNDTSAFHMAVAQRRTTFLICGGYTYDRYSRYHYADLGYVDPILIHVPMDCYDCYNYCTKEFDHVYPCVQNITVEHAWSEINQVIQENKRNG